jgi:hypothetical protein
VFTMVFGQEWYIRVKPEVDGSAEGANETGLLVGAGSVSGDGGAATLGGRARP